MSIVVLRGISLEITLGLVFYQISTEITPKRQNVTKRGNIFYSN